MSRKPSFWRLKRKVNDRPEVAVHNPPKITQKTISSFFGGSSNKSCNLDIEGGSLDGLESQDCSKRAKLDQDVNESFPKPQVTAKISDSAMTKLKNFSVPSKSGNDVSEARSRNFSDLHTAASGVPTSLSATRSLEVGEEVNEDGESPNLEQFSALKTNLNVFKSNQQSCNEPQTKIMSGKVKYTPLEQQVVDLWKQHPGVLLFVECGYKYRFFGKDAEIAAQELNIYAHMDHNFMTASIPVHRLHAHVSRLVEKGYKVGIVKQTETAALKALGDNKSAPFSRKLEHLFTRATLIGEDVDSIAQQNLDEGVSPGHIFCMTEIRSEAKITDIVFVSVNPSTGDCFYEEFSDNSSREELYKRLQIINPAEILCPISLSADSERLLNHSGARLERLPLEWFETTNAMTRVTSHFVSKIDDKSESAMFEGLTDMKPSMLGCLAALQQHLSEFGLHRAIRLDGLQSFTSNNQDFLQMDSSTIRNLHLFVSDAGQSHGSLFWALNHTKTKFGARLLQKWLAYPVRVKKVLENRYNSINELLEIDQLLIAQMKNLLSNLPDLEKGLTTILHNKCSPIQYFMTLDALCQMSSDLSSLLASIEPDTNAKQGPQGELLKKLISETVTLLGDVHIFRDNINIPAAKEGNKTKLLKDFSQFPNVLKIMDDIEDTTQSLDKLRPDIARKLSQLSVQYTCVSGQEYLVEVKHINSKCVPVNWRKISSTKQVGRYRPPAVDVLFGELQCLREKLRAECHQAWISLLQDFSQQYFKHKQAVHNVATLDVFLSLAHVAQQEGYCRPQILEMKDAKISIRRGRHPVIPLLFPSAEQFVPNDTHLESTGECCMVLSGPNMGGKSCYIRQVALIALLAHIGSYVPAEYAEISLLDSIFTRMGARDELFNGRSTLMVELEETATILQKVSRCSLVLLDELGRGTGSCDGSALACATLRHMALEVHCLTLFVTHFPSVMDTVKELKGNAENYHMAFYLENEDEAETLTFLYEVVKGAADRSYGINVARLANLDRQLLKRAAAVAADLEKQASRRRETRQMFSDLWQK